MEIILGYIFISFACRSLPQHFKLKRMSSEMKIISILITELILLWQSEQHDCASLASKWRPTFFFHRLIWPNIFSSSYFLWHSHERSDKWARFVSILHRIERQFVEKKNENQILMQQRVWFTSSRPSALAKFMSIIMNLL